MRKGLSQEALGALAGTKGNVIGQLENGTQQLTAKWLGRVAPHLDTTPDAILRGPPGDPNAFDPLMAAAQQVAEVGSDDDKRQALEILETFVRRIRA